LGPMYRRLVILSAIILAAMCGLVWLGYHSLRMWAQGMEGARLGEFATVAELIRKDVKRKLDEFMAEEQNRPYTDYQYYYVPEDVAQGQNQVLFVRSPLSGQIANGLAYGNFQVNGDGSITTPYYFSEEAQSTVDQELYAAVIDNTSNVERNLLPVLGPRLPALAEAEFAQKVGTVTQAQSELSKEAQGAKSKVSQDKEMSKGGYGRGGNYPIESFRNTDQKAQVFTQRRSTLDYNLRANTAWPVQSPGQSATELRELMQEQAVALREKESQEVASALTRSLRDQRDGNDLSQPAAMQPAAVQRARTQPAGRERSSSGGQIREPGPSGKEESRVSGPLSQPEGRQQPHMREPSSREELLRADMPQGSDGFAAETVQIRVEPFVPIVVPAADTGASIFGRQVFMVRRVQIEDTHLLQGFQLNEKELLDQVRRSAERNVHAGMSFEVSKVENPASAYPAVLDFGFGDLVLNLIDTDPGRIGRRISEQRTWYLSIVTVVLLAVALGLLSLWRNARAQLRLAQKKDDFISAVSHELRTPLTSIRMYSEMLERDWVKSEDKKSEYYRNMRQESERLSRLIENVLDFSRIQRGRKKYTFNVGDIDRCVADVVAMMLPYAEQSGFSIETELGSIGPTTFDADAVTQIVVNLLDNAIKYARDAADKVITVRTASKDGFTLIEVEDHGPGVPHRQRKKIFEEFYRVGAEATRETTGTGLGLALVKKSALAHNGFVEILGARPTGAIFKVGLAMQQ
jgi:signal transduction histidine kinase